MNPRNFILMVLLLAGVQQIATTGENSSESSSSEESDELTNATKRRPREVKRASLDGSQEGNRIWKTIGADATSDSYEDEYDYDAKEVKGTNTPTDTNSAQREGKYVWRTASQEGNAILKATVVHSTSNSYEYDYDSIEVKRSESPVSLSQEKLQKVGKLLATDKNRAQREAKYVSWTASEEGNRILQVAKDDSASDSYEYDYESSDDNGSKVPVDLPNEKTETSSEFIAMDTIRAPREAKPDLLSGSQEGNDIFKAPEDDSTANSYEYDYDSADDKNFQKPVEVLKTKRQTKGILAPTIVNGTLNRLSNLLKLTLNLDVVADLLGTLVQGIGQEAENTPSDGFLSNLLDGNGLLGGLNIGSDDGLLIDNGPVGSLLDVLLGSTKGGQLLTKLLKIVVKIIEVILNLLLELLVGHLGNTTGAAAPAITDIESIVNVLEILKEVIGGLSILKDLPTTSSAMTSQKEVVNSGTKGNQSGNGGGTSGGGKTDKQSGNGGGTSSGGKMENQGGNGSESGNGSGSSSGGKTENQDGNGSGSSSGGKTENQGGNGSGSSSGGLNGSTSNAKGNTREICFDIPVDSSGAFISDNYHRVFNVIQLVPNSKLALNMISSMFKSGETISASTTTRSVCFRQSPQGDTTQTVGDSTIVLGNNNDLEFEAFVFKQLLKILKPTQGVDAAGSRGSSNNNEICLDVPKDAGDILLQDNRNPVVTALNMSRKSLPGTPTRRICIVLPTTPSPPTPATTTPATTAPVTMTPATTTPATTTPDSITPTTDTLPTPRKRCFRKSCGKWRRTLGYRCHVTHEQFETYVVDLHPSPRFRF